jgi:DNA-binding MarR family transcriptional regulator
MLLKDGENGTGYIDQAIAAFIEIMSNKQCNPLETFSKMNKGELFVLHYLAEQNAETLPTELSEALNSSAGRISALLGTLEKNGHVERKINKQNRRNILVTITEAGRERVETEMAAMREMLIKTFSAMGEADTLEFIRLTENFFAISQIHMNEYEVNSRGGQSE